LPGREGGASASAAEHCSVYDPDLRGERRPATSASDRHVSSCHCFHCGASHQTGTQVPGAMPIGSSALLFPLGTGLCSVLDEPFEALARALTRHAELCADRAP
jgi:hypothetical protein